jgi:hypothetical protein
VSHFLFLSLYSLSISLFIFLSHYLSTLSLSFFLYLSHSLCTLSLSLSLSLFHYLSTLSLSFSIYLSLSTLPVSLYSLFIFLSLSVSLSAFLQHAFNSKSIQKFVVFSRLSAPTPSDQQWTCFNENPLKIYAEFIIILLTIFSLCSNALVHVYTCMYTTCKWRFFYGQTIFVEINYNTLLLFADNFFSLDQKS